jgi:uncharacterized protein YbjT (DUF2867 family)
MKIVLFGASGMIGQGVQRECLLADDVTEVVSVVRRRGDATHAKLREIEHADFEDFSPIASELAGCDACFYALGVSSAGMDEAAYTRVTHGFTIAAARTLYGVAPGLTFVFVSGAGTDDTERGSTMWARVKGKTENDLRAMGFARAVMFRPGIILPKHGATSKTRSYRILYTIFGPLFWGLRAIAPQLTTTTEEIGRAMLEVARHGSDQPICDTKAIRALARRAAR